jgi:hypothetical protein
MGNSLKVSLTSSSLSASSSISSGENSNNTNYYSQPYMVPPNFYNYYSGWLQHQPPYPPPSSHPPSHLPSHPQSHSQSQLYLPSVSYTTNTSTLESTSLSDTSQVQRKIEPSIKDFLEELDKKFGENRYTIYLPKFEKEEITVLQIAEINPEILLNDFNIEIVGRRLNLIKEAKKYL